MHSSRDRSCKQDENIDDASRALKALEWLGMLKDTRTVPPSSVIDSFCHIMEDHLSYQPGEDDVVLMHHDLQAVFDDGSVESYTSELHVRGSEKASAMSQT